MSDDQTAPAVDEAPAISPSILERIRAEQEAGRKKLAELAETSAMYSHVEPEVDDRQTSVTIPAAEQIAAAREAELAAIAAASQAESDRIVAEARAAEAAADEPKAARKKPKDVEPAPDPAPADDLAALLN